MCMSAGSLADLARGDLAWLREVSGWIFEEIKKIPKFFRR